MARKRRSDSKAAGREKFGKLFYLLRRGREYFIFYKRSEIKNLVTRDRIPQLYSVIYFIGEEGFEPSPDEVRDSGRGEWRSSEWDILWWWALWSRNKIWDESDRIPQLYPVIYFVGGRRPSVLRAQARRGLKAAGREKFWKLFYLPRRVRK